MIPFIKPYYDDDDFNAIKQVLQSGWVAQGPKVEEFEEAAAKYLGCKYTISVSNCTTALTLALMALEIGPGDEVIVPDFTFPATVIAVTNVGATPVLVDVNRENYNVSPQMVALAITRKTKAIIPVHLFGLSCNMHEINSLASTYGLYVIEDAACSLGTEIDVYGSEDEDQLKAGTMSDIGCFSLQASKGITTGEGGLICTNDYVLADRMRRLSCFGDERTFRRSLFKQINSADAPFYFDPKAGNYKMSDITAALALSQLRKIEKMIDWRIKIAKEWDEVVNGDPFLRSVIISKPEIMTDHSHIYQSYVMVCQQGKRPLVMEYFKEHGFQTGIGTHACSRYPNLMERQSKGQERLPPILDCGVSNYLYENAISLPRYYGLEVLREWKKAKLK